jgi:hypothetical protein
MAAPEIKYAPDLTKQLAEEGKPGYVRNLQGAQVPIDTPAAAYAVAEIAANAFMLSNRAYEIYQTLINSGQKGSNQLAEIAWVSYLQMAAQVGRNMLILADLCDRFHLPTSIQSQRMANYNVSLEWLNPTQGKPIHFAFPNDWRVWANKWNKSIADAQPTTGTLAMSGAGGGMGFLPALLGASGIELALATGATLTVAWPAVLIVGLVGAATVIGIYAVSKGADWWTEHDRVEQKIVQERLACFDKYAKQFAETGDQKLREIMLKCAEQADDHGTDWMTIAYLAAGAVGIWAISSIYKTSKT